MLSKRTALAITSILMLGVLLAAAAPMAVAAPAPAIPEAGATPQPGVQRLTYRVGPLTVTPGQNRISYAAIKANSEKPAVDGWITRFKPNMTYADGTVPKTNLVMFHHGVWINLSRQDATTGGPERLYATGEEKTITDMPKGYGYRYKASDRWALNYMIHNLTPEPMQLYITYEIDFIPATAPEAQAMTPVRPIWMDVQNGSIYPVFDVHRGSGGADGEFTYPADEANPYPDGRVKNMWQVDHDGVLVATAGHVHTGGLGTDLWLRRAGGHYQGQDCRALRDRTKRRKCARTAPAVRGNRAHLFHSEASYWEPRGPVSWDVSMTGTKPGWRVAVHQGDMLEVSATYETERASWYESMGIMVVYMADGNWGKDPYSSKVDWPGQVTHGHLPENSVHGGSKTDLPDARALPSGSPVPASDPLSISGFTYEQGDLRFAAPGDRPPVVKRGKSLTFELSSGDASQEIWHSLTSCAAPCNASTGIAYPIADGKFQFDSGQLGTHTPAVGRETWTTPSDLPAGTYTYFCRIHPLMRGSFRVTK